MAYLGLSASRGQVGGRENPHVSLTSGNEGDGPWDKGRLRDSAALARAGWWQMGSRGPSLTSCCLQRRVGAG